MTNKSLPRYSTTYEDDRYQYRHVIVDRSLVSLIPKNRLMDECEWRALGIKQGAHWEHYLIHKPEPFVLMFRRMLKYRSEPDPSMDPVNSHCLNARVPISANRKALSTLNDSTNKPGVFRMSINKSYQEMNESGFESH